MQHPQIVLAHLSPALRDWPQGEDAFYSRYAKGPAQGLRHRIALRLRRA